MSAEPSIDPARRSPGPQAVAEDRLADLDTTLCARPQPPLTLAPDRERAHLPTQLVEMLVDERDWPPFAVAVAEGVADVYDAMLRAFPHNLFWDLDGLFGSVIAQARTADDSAVAVARALRQVAALQDVFGRGPINFRYIHDFVYGFDWAKWVAKDPEHRRNMGPFSTEFVGAMHERGHELLDVIERDVDEKYPPLPGDESRNPFGFSREPADEVKLHRTLARRGLIPVQAWSLQPAATWDRPFAALRTQVAAELGLSR
jgi:hypothetical protein